MTDWSDEPKLTSESGEGAPRDHVHDWLLVSSNVALGVSLIGIPWTYIQPNGQGPTLSFVGIFVALLLRSFRPESEPGHADGSTSDGEGGPNPRDLNRGA